MPYFVLSRVGMTEHTDFIHCGKDFSTFSLIVTIDVHSFKKRKLECNQPFLRITEYVFFLWNFVLKFELCDSGCRPAYLRICG